MQVIDQVTLKADNQADVAATVGAGNGINIIAPTINLQKECHLDAKAVAVVAANHVASAATIEGQLIQVQAKDTVLKEGSHIKPQGPHALAIIKTENLVAENNSKATACPHADQKTDNVNNQIIILTKRADLQKGSQFDAEAMTIAAENIYLMPQQLVANLSTCKLMI